MNIHITYRESDRAPPEGDGAGSKVKELYFVNPCPTKILFRVQLEANFTIFNFIQTYKIKTSFRG